MIINIVGGGPAGLYFALLMKRRDAACSVAVWERDRPGAAPGWGLVFSGAALTAFEAADPQSAADLAAHLQHWDKVQITLGADTVSVGGQHYSGIARVDLLQTLKRHCVQAGVTIHHGVEMSDLATLPPADLLVGSGGRSCRVRDSMATAFGTRVTEHDNRFIWLGTARRFEGLNLIFRSTEAGAFAAHAYQYSAEMSTFIVDCTAETFRRGGLADMNTESTLRALERIFREDLHGEPLRGSPLGWDRFRVVRNTTWQTAMGGQAVTLLGDSLHTTHFSIGSGTKLAMESAIALADSLGQGDRLEDALARFEVRRRPSVERSQALAESSMRWFESFEADMHLPPYAFALRCMSRSGRINLEELSRRAPQFVAAWHAEQHHAGP